mgnify:CR=1 FL=1
MTTTDLPRAIGFYRHVLGLPFLVSGGLKIVYDLGMLVAFRKIRPADETSPTPARERS